MGSFIFFLYLATTMAIVITNTLLVHSSSDDKNNKHNGPVVNVTKHLTFSNFTSLTDVKLLGSARLSTKTGAVQIPDDSLVDDLRHLAGRALYSSPIRLLDPRTQTPASFFTTFSFHFHNATSSSVQRSQSLGQSGGYGYGGSGLAFVIVPDEFTVGRPGAWLGMMNDACEDDYKVIAIEFDNRLNPEFGDPNDNHVGINLGTIISTKTADASDVGVDLDDGTLHRAWISYDGVKRWMEITLGADDNNGSYPLKPIYSGSIDLSPFLNEYMFVGFSASTGNHTQVHSIVSWNFTSVSQAFLTVPSMETCESNIVVDSPSRAEPQGLFLIFMAVLALSVAVMLSLYYNSRRRKKAKMESGGNVVFPEKKMSRPRPPHKPRGFSLSEISMATRSFGELEVLGGRGRGVCYRGKLSNGCQVAVKRFSSEFLSSLGLDRRRLLKEIKKISKVRHPNLVPIRGWCGEKDETIVVYEFFTNGGLDKWLFGVGVLPWTRRFKVVKEIGEALSFLHSKHLAHKNMKTTSVFLDVSFRAVLGDFGFVLCGAESRRFEAAVSQGADVFEFGIFVLEVVCGRRRRVEGEMGEERDLLEFTWRMHEIGEMRRVVDKRMGAVINLEQAIRVVEIGLLCTVNVGKGRPSMEQVVEFLCNEKPIPELPQTRPVSLFPYNSTSALCTGYSCAPFK